MMTVRLVQILSVAILVAANVGCIEQFAPQARFKRSSAPPAARERAALDIDPAAPVPGDPEPGALASEEPVEEIPVLVAEPAITDVEFDNGPLLTEAAIETISVAEELQPIEAEAPQVTPLQSPLAMETRAIAPNREQASKKDTGKKDTDKKDEGKEDSGKKDTSKKEAAAKKKPPRRLPRPMGPNQTYYLNFDDLEINMEQDQRFKESMLTPNVRKLDGKRVRISGVIHAGTLYKQTGVKRFVMLKNIECPFGKGATAHHNMRVTLSEGIDYTTRPVTVEGILKVEPFHGPDGNTWALYTLKGKAK